MNLAEKKRSISDKMIRESLELQLREKGADVDHFQDQIAQYLFFRKAFRQASKDYRDNGSMIKVISAAGKECDKENPAIKQAAMCNQRMLAILKDLGLTADTCNASDSGDSDLG